MIVLQSDISHAPGERRIEKAACDIHAINRLDMNYKRHIFDDPDHHNPTMEKVIIELERLIETEEEMRDERVMIVKILKKQIKRQRMGNISNQKYVLKFCFSSIFSSKLIR